MQQYRSFPLHQCNRYKQQFTRSAQEICTQQQQLLLLLLFHIAWSTGID
jgi:hypothetical protein